MIYYLGWYKSQHIRDCIKSGNNAATFKMGYIIRKCKELGKPITVVSCCASDKVGFVPLRRVEVDDLQTEDYLPSLRMKGIFRKIMPVFRNREILKYLKEKVKKEDTVIVYHALGLDKVLKKAKKKIGFRLILEVEEIYHVDTKCKNPSMAKKQEQAMIDLADSYIVVNDLIYNKYIANGKEHLVLYGAYDGECISTKNIFEKGKHILFSGSLDKVRGATLAVETAAFLSKEYTLHICGTGSPSFVTELKAKIERHNRTEHGCEIEFHGELARDVLDELACVCDIGLNLQDTNNPFEAVSFPSKITFYLLHGLNVVSTKMSSILASSLSESLCFCEEQPKAVAESIMSLIVSSKEENRTKVKKLDGKAKEQLEKLLG